MWEADEVPTPSLLQWSWASVSGWVLLNWVSAPSCGWC